jgi:hypothetical protein
MRALRKGLAAATGLHGAFSGKKDGGEDGGGVGRDGSASVARGGKSFRAAPSSAVAAKLHGGAKAGSTVGPQWYEAAVSLYVFEW